MGVIIIPITNTRDIYGDSNTCAMLIADTLSSFVDDTVYKLRYSAFYSCSTLEYVELPALRSSTIGYGAFSGCVNLSFISLENAQYLGEGMFNGCKKLSSIYAPKVQSTSYGVFSYCEHLSQINFPLLSYVQSGAFYGCYRLSSISMPLLLSIYSGGFNRCFGIRTASFSKLNGIGSYGFYQCYKLSEISVPKLSIMRDTAFNGVPINKLVLHSRCTCYSYVCNRIVELDFQNGFDCINSSQFANNTWLLRLIIRWSSVNTLASNALSNTPIASGIGKIYVPDNLVSAYKTNSRWSAYASQIDSINNYTDAPPPSLETISDSWNEIIANPNYSTDYSIGDTKWLNIYGRPVLMQIVAFDTDELSNNSGNAHITWLSSGPVFEACMDFGYNYGWHVSDLRDWLQTDIMQSISSDVRSNIKEVKKTTRILYNSGNSVNVKQDVINDTIWIPSKRELNNTVSSNTESSGCTYTGNIDFTKGNPLCNTQYWTRTCGTGTGYFYTCGFNVGTNNFSSFSNEQYSQFRGVVIGFCT